MWEKILSLEELKGVREQARREGKRVVFTNGCFDLLHRGHVEYLHQAKQLGDLLIVGLNSDSSVRQIKGNRRPIVPQGDRALVLAALEAVDYVCIFDEPTPARLITELVPDMLVKGGDYRIDQIVGREVVSRAGGQVITIDEVKGYSTRNLIQLIMERYKGVEREGTHLGLFEQR